MKWSPQFINTAQFDRLAHSFFRKENYVEEVLMKTSLRDVVAEINENLLPVRKLVTAFEPHYEFLQVNTHYYASDEIDRCLGVNTVDWFAKDKTDVSWVPIKVEKYIKEGDDIMFLDSPAPLKESDIKNFKDDGLISVDLQYSEFCSIGFFLMTASGLHTVKEKFPDIYRGLTEETVIQINRQDGRSFPDKLYPARYRWSETKDVVLEDNNMVWWFYEYDTEGLCLIPQEQNLQRPYAHSSYCSGLEDGSHRRLNVRLDLMKPIFERINLNSILTMGGW
jgi:hypothetical protein